MYLILGLLCSLHTSSPAGTMLCSLACLLGQGGHERLTAARLTLH